MLLKLYIEKSFCGCSLRAGTLFIGWLYFILCLVPSLVFIFIGTIQIHKFLETYFENQRLIETATTKYDSFESATFHYWPRARNYESFTESYRKKYELEEDSWIDSYNRKHIDDNSIDESSSMKPEDENNDDSPTYKKISDMEKNYRFEYIIGGVILGVQEGAFLYSVILGLIFGFGANFNFFLLIGAYFDISLPIVIWLAGQALFLLFVDLSLQAAAFYSANIFLIIIQSLKFGFNLYCLLVVRSHLHLLNQSVKSKSIETVKVL